MIDNPASPVRYALQMDKAQQSCAAPAAKVNVEWASPSSFAATCGLKIRQSVCRQSKVRIESCGLKGDKAFFELCRWNIPMTPSEIF